MDGHVVFNNTQEQNAQKIQEIPVEKLTPPPPDSLSPFKKILKIIIGLGVLALIIFLIFSFVLPRFSQKKTEKVTLVYWGLWEDKRVMQSIISDFERENPNITVDYQKQDIKDYRERITTRINNGTGPDIFRFHNTWLPMVSNLLLPLSKDVIDKEEFKNSYYQVVQEDLIKNGAIYGIPVSIDTLALFTNDEALKAAGVEVPTSWDEFSRTARTLTVKDETGKIKNAGAALGTFDNVTHAADIVSLLFVQNGVDLKNFESSSKNVVDALSFYVDFAKEDDRVWDSNLDNSILAFSQGNLSMYLGFSWDIFIIKSLNPDLNFSIHPVPHLPGRTTTIASYWPEGVSVKSKYQKEAFMFLKFLTQKETAQKLYSEEAKTRFFGEPYSRSDLGETLKGSPFAYPFVSQAKDASSSYFASDTFDNGLNSQSNTYLGNAVRAMFGNTSPETTVKTLTEGINQVLSQYAQ